MVKIKVLVKDNCEEGYSEPLVAIAINGDVEKLKEWAWQKRLKDTKHWSKPDTDRESFMQFFKWNYEIIETEML
jgi:hypothetical protein